MESNSSHSHHGAKVLFWYLGLFLTLSITAFATGAIWYQLINKVVPLAISPNYVRAAFSQGAVKSALAALIVGAPILLAFGMFIRKAIARHKIVLNQGVRQWISYLILFIVIATAIGDVISFLTHVFDGDYTLRFILKSLTILIITGWIFTYFWLSLRSSDGLSTSPIPKYMGAISAVVIVATLVSGFFIIDSPATARAKAFDQDRANDLSSLQYQIQQYYTRVGALPKNLQQLQDEGFARAEIASDPFTGEAYEYSIVTEEEFELCATFTTDNRDEPNKEYYRAIGPSGQAFLHAAERTCFTENAKRPLLKEGIPQRVPGQIFE